MFEDIKRLSFKHKNNKSLYYLNNYLSYYLSAWNTREDSEKKLSQLVHYKDDYINKRVEYYNRLDDNCQLSQKTIQIKDFNLKEHRKTYFFDTLKYLKHFSQELKFEPLFGDITHIPDFPCLVKSRPIYGDNRNSVILKLDRVRHFLFVKDSKSFEEKKNMLIGRAKCSQEHRIRFLNMYFNHPMCNIGQVNRNINPQFIRERLTIDEHLNYKFILSLEGNDVASNLKWVMSSNSIAVMPKPKFETWFMEGLLIPDYHYICIKDDYSDLEEKLNYYIENTDKAKEIIENAHAYISQFRNKEQEDLISFLVLKKYFEKTGQLK